MPLLFVILDPGFRGVPSHSPTCSRRSRAWGGVNPHFLELRMADLLTHLAIGHVLKRRSPWPSHPLLFALGTCLPDLTGRASGLALYSIELLLGRDMPYTLSLGLDVFHTPLPYLLLCLLVGWAWPEAWRRTLVYNLLLGGLTHFPVDFLQRHLRGGYQLAYPFSRVECEAGWIGTEDSLYVAPLLALLALAVELHYRRTRPRTQALEQPQALEPTEEPRG